MLTYIFLITGTWITPVKKFNFKTFFIVVSVALLALHFTIITMDPMLLLVCQFQNIFYNSFSSSYSSSLCHHCHGPNATFSLLLFLVLYTKLYKILTSRCSYFEQHNSCVLHYVLKKNMPSILVNFNHMFWWFNGLFLTFIL